VLFRSTPATTRPATPALGQRSRRLIQRRRLAWLTQIIQILAIEGAERGFDRGAEAGYALPNIFAEKRSPHA